MIAERGNQPNGAALIVGLVGEAATSVAAGATVKFKLTPDVAKVRREKSSISLSELQGDATAGMEGTAVYVGGRMAGLLLVNLDAAGKPKAPHSILPAGRIRELLDLP
jgi:hypothetical protein